MSRVRGKDTGPEKMVRRIAHGLGLRFRLHRKELPGKPDLVFPKYRFVTFVHGCFWHRHPGCKRASFPSTRQEFWAQKFTATVARDAEQALELEKRGWRVGVIWECELKGPERVAERLLRWTRGNEPKAERADEPPAP